MRASFYLIILLLISLSVNTLAQDECADCDKEQVKVSWVKKFLPFYFENVTKVMDEILPLKNIDYDQNTSATYCKRSLDYLTTVVIHHTGAPPRKRAEDINSMHLVRGSKSDPWRMVGYNYLVSDRYDQKGESEMFVGRPLDMVGAHAGTLSYSSRVSDTVKKKMNKQGVMCGKSEDRLKKQAVPMSSTGEVKTNYSSIGVALMGSYSRLSKSNPGGYVGVKRYPGNAALLNVAKLICSLQKKHKTLKYIRLHKEVRSDPTGCPGLVEKKIGKIKTYAQALGCVFE
jgi:hypothetical protein